MNDTDGSNKPTLDRPASGAQRRTFVKTAAGAALLSTVVSRPVWANHCSISGNLSGNLSGQEHEEPCTLASYSPGAWLNGSGSGLWEHVSPYTLSSTVGSLLGVAELVSQKKNGNGLTADSSIQEALGGGSHGWERQCCAAALNALLWQSLLHACEASPADCSELSDADSTFYFPYTLADIRTTYLAGSGPDQQLWEQAQTID